MFTGIITQVGVIESLSVTDEGARLVVNCKEQNGAQKLVVGASYAINGACLTLVNDSFPLAFDISLETLQKTTFSTLVAGSLVNIEPAMRLGDPVDGHLVSGHVDAVGEVSSLVVDGNSLQLCITFPEHLARYIASKGSICVDGVSLTVNDIIDNYFSVAIVPHTLGSTRIETYKVGMQVNLEIDLVARYIARLVAW